MLCLSLHFVFVDSWISSCCCILRVIYISWCIFLCLGVCCVDCIYFKFSLFCVSPLSVSHSLCRPRFHLQCLCVCLSSLMSVPSMRSLYRVSLVSVFVSTVILCPFHLFPVLFCLSVSCVHCVLLCLLSPVSVQLVSAVVHPLLILCMSVSLWLLLHHPVCCISMWAMFQSLIPSCLILVYSS